MILYKSLFFSIFRLPSFACYNMYNFKENKRDVKHKYVDQRIKSGNLKRNKTSKAFFYKWFVDSCFQIKNLTKDKNI